MIDISTQAPVATASEGAAALTGQFGAAASASGSEGAAGFLHLFEILLGGMPQGGKIGSVAGLVPDANSASGVAGMPMPGAGNSLAGTLTAAGADVTAAAMDQLSTLMQDGLGSQDAQAIAGLLQVLGFQVDASEVASLGELDLQQLDAAMEFIQRGLQTGASVNEILENAACLMPREWNWNGAAETTVPRSASLATGEEGESEVDPSRILAASEAVRQMLSSMLPKGADAVEAEAVQSPSIGAIAIEGADESVSIGATAVQEKNGQRPSMEAPIREAGESFDKPAFDVRKGITIRREGTVDPAPVAVSTQSTTADAVVARDAKGVPMQEAVPGGSVAREKAQTSRVSSADAFAASGWGAKPSAEIVATATTSIGQGVKAGSMASEFIGRQVLEKVDVQLRQGRRELNVRLWPEELGEVRLSLRVGEADKLDARILVQTESVRQAILDATPQLREALSRHGMEMGRLSVNVGTETAGGGDASGGERRRSSEDGAGRFHGSAGWNDETVEYGAALALGVDSGFRDGRNTLDMWS